MNDLERANEKVAVMEREKEVLKAQLEAPQGTKQLEEQYFGLFFLRWEANWS